MGRARASRRHPGELPRQRRRRDRHVSHGRRARAEAGAARQRAPEDHALHAGQRPIWCAASRRSARCPALFTTYAYYNPDKFVYYGEEMMKNCMAFRSLLDAGVYAAAGLGLQPGPIRRRSWASRAWSRARAGTARCGARTSASASSEAIAVNTYNGAWASGEEAIKGSITAGKLADYVVLADDPHTVDAGEDQGHPDRADGGRRKNLAPGLKDPPSRGRILVAARPGRVSPAIHVSICDVQPFAHRWFVH